MPEELSPMDTSAEALAARYEKRKKWREDTKGTKPLTNAIREFEREKGKQEPPEPTEQTSPETGDILREAAASIGTAAETMASAANIQERMATGDYRLSLPKERKSQLLYVRTILEGIERSNRDCHDWSISSLVKGLEASLVEMDPNVAQEVKARLAVHDSSELVRQAGGWIERGEEVGPGYALGSAATESNRRNHDLDRRTIDLFLRKGLPDLKIAQAWDLLQDANFSYIEMVKEVNKKTSGEKDKPFEIKGFELRDDEITAGKVPTSFYADSDSNRREAVRQLLIDKLGGDRLAETSLNLAEKLIIATLETSVFNRTAMTGNDELAEIIGLKGWRKGREETGRARGPKIHEKAIEGFGTSWIRRFREEDDVNKPIYARDIDIDKIPEGNWLYFCTAILARYNLLKKLLLDRKPKPRTIDKTFLQQAVVYFNTADGPELTLEEIKKIGGGNRNKAQLTPEEIKQIKETQEAKEYLSQKKCGPKKLRLLWALGLHDVALADFSLEWTPRDFGELAKALTKEELSPQAGTFIGKDQLEWILKTVKFSKRIKAIGTRKAIEGILEKAF